MQILILFIFIFFLILVIGLTIVSRILNAFFSIFNIGKQNKSTKNKDNGPTPNNAPAPKKIIDKDEGEYVDFEEIKEDK